MARDVNAATVTEGQGEVVRVAWLVQLEYDSGISRVNSTLSSIFWDPDGGSPDPEFSGVGELLQISGVEETAEQKARSVTMTLSGVPASAISLALSPFDYVGRKCTAWIALLDENNAIVGAPSREIIGLMDTQDIEVKGKEGLIQLTLTDRRSRWDQPLRRRYTNEQQQARFPGDKGLEFIASLVDKEIAWPEKLAPRTA